MVLEQFCVNHPMRKATSFCHHCERYYCHECLKEGSEFYYCQSAECLKALETELHPPAPPEAGEEEETLEPAETLPESQVFLALYPNAHEADGVKARLESEGLECHSVEKPCGRIHDSYIVPIELKVKEADAEKAAQVLAVLKSEGHPEPIDEAMNFIGDEDAEDAKAKLTSLGIQSFLWDSIGIYDNRIHEAFSVLTRVSDKAKASNVLIVPESE